MSYWTDGKELDTSRQGWLESLRRACDWTVDVSMVTTQESSYGEDSSFVHRGEYADRCGSFRGEYAAATRTWDVFCPIWHGGQGVKALVMAAPFLEPQLFNLERDTGELENLAPDRPDVVADMDAKLREIVDYDEVHQRVLAYDKASFREWRERAKRGEFSTEEYGNKGKPLTTYEAIMKNSYHGFGPEHEEKLERWLADPTPRP